MNLINALNAKKSLTIDLSFVRNGTSLSKKIISAN